jgi:sugar lactone lactonase YvrE
MNEETRMQSLLERDVNNLNEINDNGNLNDVKRDRTIKRVIALALGSLVFGVLVLMLTLQAVAQATPFPDLIELPDGFSPEGITRGRGTTVYVGSIPTGAIYQADLRTGEGSILVPPQEGRHAVGMTFDKRTNYLFVAGLTTGRAFVYDTTTGATVGDFQLTTEPVTGINDVAFTRDAVYFTDSNRPVYYRLPLLSGGRLPDPSAVEEIPLSGDFEFVPGALNSNGIAATANGKTLIIAHTHLGKLYHVDAASGRATEIAVGVGCGPVGADGSDGLILDGRTLYVVNFYNQVIKIRLDPGLTSGVVQDVITSLLLDPWPNPTTGVLYGDSVYVVSSKFSLPPTPETEYRIVKLPLH